MANTFTGAFPAIYSKKYLTNYDLAVVMPKLVSTTYQTDVKAFGNVVHMSHFGNVTISTYTPGTDMTPQALSTTDNTLSLNQFKGFDYIIDATEIKQSHLPLLNKWMQRASIAMAQTIDDALLAHYADADAGNVIGSDAAPLSLTPDNVYDYCLMAAENLDNNGIPEEDRYLVIDPNTRSLIRKSPDFVKNTELGDTVVRKGQVGEIAGFTVMVSARLTAVSGVKNLMYFHKDFIQFAAQFSPKNFKTYDPQHQHGVGVKGLTIYGSAVPQGIAGGVIKKAA